MTRNASSVAPSRHARAARSHARAERGTLAHPVTALAQPDQLLTGAGS